jgi:hypothetical protein
VSYSYVQQFNGSFADLSEAQNKVAEFGEMHQDWDGYGAEPIGLTTSGNTSQALNVLSYQLPMPDITPNPNGTLSLEWMTEAGSAHLEIGRTKCSLYVNSIANISPLFFAGHPTDINGQVGALVYSSLYTPLKQTKPVSLPGETGHGR